MNNKFYVSYEAARLLKEKGYNEETICYYNCAGKLYLGNGNFNYNAYAINLSAPTKSEAIDWLESKGIVVELNYDDQAHMDNARWQYFIYTHDNDGWVEALVCGWYENDFYPTRLETEEAAIIKALELL